MRYLLFHERDKPGQPVSRVKLADAVKERFATHRLLKKWVGPMGHGARCGRYGLCVFAR